MNHLPINAVGVVDIHFFFFLFFVQMSQHGISSFSNIVRQDFVISNNIFLLYRLLNNHSQ